MKICERVREGWKREVCMYVKSKGKKDEGLESPC